MDKTEHKRFSQPDETREFPNGCAEILEVGGGQVGRLIFQPGGAGRTTSGRALARQAVGHRTSSTT
jgi:hypothetical protein